jgi:UDP-2,3-diacylglucosamine pyrophosphatase LpxH
MDDKPVTLIISDLHMGDGKAGDDFVDDNHQLVSFLRLQAATPEGRAGRIELIINGDFLELVQVCPEAYSLGSSEYWCSESESLTKLECILRGHADIFAALKEFQEPEGDGPKNRVTLFPGNHDVDLHWPAVRKRIREVAGDVNIELDCVDYHRYRGRLCISHGHLLPSLDPANGFKDWKNPVLTATKPARLEMCPGTLFVVKFVNLLEAKYPFADNLHPETALAGILWREDAWGLKTVAWMLTRFASRHPQIMLSSETGTGPDVVAHLLESIRVDAMLQADVSELYRDVLSEEVTADEVPGRLNSEAKIADFVERLMRADVPWERWVKVLNGARPDVLGVDEAGGGTLTIVAAGQVNVRKQCLELAEARWRAGAEIVVFGHTHLPQKIERQEGRYYNPGSWTRYVDEDLVGSLTLADLEREDLFPFELKCVRVEDMADGSLKSEMICIDQRRPARDS